MKALVPSFYICKSLAKSCQHGWWCSFQSENNIHIVVQKRSGPHSPISMSYVSLHDFFLGNTYYRYKKKKPKNKNANIFSSLIIYGEIWWSASVSSPPFPKHCLSAVWLVGSAEFLPEINEGTSPTFVELSQPRRPLKPTCSLQVSCSSTDSSQTCLADEIWHHHSLSWPNLFSLWDLTGSQLEVPQEIWWDHSLRLSWRNSIYTLIQSLHKS